MITLSHWMSAGFVPPAISNIMLGRHPFEFTHSLSVLGEGSVETPPFF